MLGYLLCVVRKSDIIGPAWRIEITEHTPMFANIASPLSFLWLSWVCCYRYRQEAWHPVTLPVDLPCSHVVQRLVLVFSDAKQQLWVLLVKGIPSRLVFL